MSQLPETKPCTYDGCTGTMRLRTGADPTLQGTSQGNKQRSVEYYRCDKDDGHTHVVRQVEWRASTPVSMASEKQPLRADRSTRNYPDHR